MSALLLTKRKSSNFFGRHTLQIDWKEWNGINMCLIKWNRTRNLETHLLTIWLTTPNKPEFIKPNDEKTTKKHNAMNEKKQQQQPTVIRKSLRAKITMQKYRSGVTTYCKCACACANQTVCKWAELGQKPYSRHL